MVESVSLWVVRKQYGKKVNLQTNIKEKEKNCFLKESPTMKCIFYLQNYIQYMTKKKARIQKCLTSIAKNIFQTETIYYKTVHDCFVANQSGD